MGDEEGELTIAHADAVGRRVSDIAADQRRLQTRAARIGDQHMRNRSSGGQRQADAYAIASVEGERGFTQDLFAELAAAHDAIGSLQRQW